jgi:hypothetical protein
MPLPASEAATHAYGRSQAGWARRPAPFNPVGHVFERAAPKLEIRRAVPPHRQLLAFFG